MPAWSRLLDPFGTRTYGRKAPLVLINGLAEQAETWFRNHRFWSRYFDVHMPNLLVYDGDALHRRIQSGEPISVEYLVQQLHLYLDQYVQRPPYHLVASSLGGKIAVEFAVRYPELTNRLVLICPSGMGDKEQLPIIEGVRRNDMTALVGSVFYRRRHVDRNLVKFYRSQFPNRKWKTGLLRTVRGTMDHVVRPLMPKVQAPTLLIAATEDKIVCPKEAEKAAAELPNGHFLMIPHCGHAPQQEKPWLINRLVTHFLTSPKPTSHPRFLQLLLANPSPTRT